MTPQHEGHRKRLLERYEKNGLDSLGDYEVIELLLTFVITRRDTKQLAKDLLAKFKTVNGVLNADPKDVLLVKGIGGKSAFLFSLIRDTVSYSLRERFEKKSVFQKRQDVEDYLRFHFGLRRDEYMAAIFLDNANSCIATEIIAEGTVNQCAVYPRVIMEKALARRATSIILAHNHPGGSTQASRADWSITERLFNAAKLLDIRLLDHLVISQDKVISLRELPRWPK